MEMVSRMGSGIFVLPLIGILESVSIAKAFGKQLFFKLPFLPRPKHDDTVGNDLNYKDLVADICGLKLTYIYNGVCYLV